ncbi:MAG: hemolysin family protein, partial [Anaerolineae bacterium]
MLTGLLVFAVLFVLQTLLSIIRLAFHRVRRQPLKEDAEDGSEKAQAVLDLIDHIEPLDAALRAFAIIVAFLASSALLISLLPVLRPTPVMLAVFTGSLLYYVLSQVLALLVVTDNSNRWAIRLLPLTRALTLFMQPLTAVEIGLWNRILKRSEGKNGAHITEEDVMTLLAAGEEEGSIEIQEREMISRVFRLDDTLAREIMIPRIDVVALEINTPIEEARRVIIEAGHSRIPVFEGSLDQVKGLLYAKDLLEVWDQGDAQISLAALLRPPVFVPETQIVSELLGNLQYQAVHMEIVIDEYGGTAGLVTIEDIVEEIVGEILDEYDEDEEAIYQMLTPNDFIFDARVDLDDFNQLLEVKMPVE